MVALTGGRRRSESRPQLASAIRHYIANYVRLIGTLQLTVSSLYVSWDTMSNTWVDSGLNRRSGTCTGKYTCCVGQCCGHLSLQPTPYKVFERYRGNRIDWPLMYYQGFLNLLSVGKLGKGGANPIIGNHGLCKMQICGGGMGNHTPLMVTQSFKLSLTPLIVPHRLRRGSERGVKCE